MDNNSQAAITQLGCFVYTKAYIVPDHHQSRLAERDMEKRNTGA